MKICKDVFCRIKAGYRLPTPIFLGRFIQMLLGEMNSLQDTSWYKAHAASKEINGLFEPNKMYGSKTKNLNLKQLYIHNWHIHPGFFS